MFIDEYQNLTNEINIKYQKLNMLSSKTDQQSNIYKVCFYSNDLGLNDYGLTGTFEYLCSAKFDEKLDILTGRFFLFYNYLFKLLEESMFDYIINKNSHDLLLTAENITVQRLILLREFLHVNENDINIAIEKTGNKDIFVRFINIIKSQGIILEQNNNSITNKTNTNTNQAKIFDSFKDNSFINAYKENKALNSGPLKIPKSALNNLKTNFKIIESIPLGNIDEAGLEKLNEITEKIIIIYNDIQARINSKKYKVIENIFKENDVVKQHFMDDRADVNNRIIVYDIKHSVVADNNRKNKNTNNEKVLCNSSKVHLNFIKDITSLEGLVFSQREEIPYSGRLLLIYYGFMLAMEEFFWDVFLNTFGKSNLDVDTLLGNRINDSVRHLMKSQLQNNIMVLNVLLNIFYPQAESWSSRQNIMFMPIIERNLVYGIYFLNTKNYNLFSSENNKKNNKIIAKYLAATYLYITDYLGQNYMVITPPFDQNPAKLKDRALFTLLTLMHNNDMKDFKIDDENNNKNNNKKKKRKRKPKKKILKIEESIIIEELKIEEPKTEAKKTPSPSDQAATNSNKFKQWLGNKINLSLPHGKSTNIAFVALGSLANSMWTKASDCELIAIIDDFNPENFDAISKVMQELNDEKVIFDKENLYPFFNNKGSYFAIGTSDFLASYFDLIFDNKQLEFNSINNIEIINAYNNNVKIENITNLSISFLNRIIITNLSINFLNTKFVAGNKELHDEFTQKITDKINQHKFSILNQYSLKYKKFLDNTQKGFNLNSIEDINLNIKKIFYRPLQIFLTIRKILPDLTNDIKEFKNYVCDLRQKISEKPEEISSPQDYLTYLGLQESDFFENKTIKIINDILLNLPVYVQ